MGVDVGFAKKNIVDIIPWVLNLPTWLPGMGWMKQILIWRSWVRTGVTVSHSHLISHQCRYSRLE